ncbi:MAG TPA: VWA domain-containing protein [Bacteroidia bacterium]|nr:VWA domain-containing protein [Bacteroidia bacterium]
MHSQTYEQGSTNFATPKKYDANSTTRILFIFDDSFSMFGKWGNGTKIDVSKKLMGEFLDSLKNTPKLQLALRCYGHQTPFRPNRNCQDSKLEVPFDSAFTNCKKIKDRINRLQPTGTTPIAYSLGESANDFPPCDNCRNIVILITDGIEECDGDPCAVSLALQKKGVFLRPFIIGVGLDVKFADVFGCMGKFYDVSNEANFKQVMKLVFIEAISQTTVQVNLLDTYKKPSETDVTMTFYNQKTGEVKYNYLHTLNHRGNPDTLVLDPDVTYKMVVHTIPPQVKENIVLQKGKHNIIPLDAPQGYLNLQTDGPIVYKSLQCIVRKGGQENTLNVQDFGATEKYITGKYDLEILSLPRIKLPNIDIKQSSTNLIKIPSAGTLSINKGGLGYGSVYLENGKKIEWVCNLIEGQQAEVFYLQPGNYRVEFRLKTQLESEKTVEKKFTIESNKTTAISLF